jgi:hypothetical protein
MLDFKTQSQLLDATAAMVLSCVTAATGAFAASASQGLSLWSDLLRAASRPLAAPASPSRFGADPLGLSLWPSPANWPWMQQLSGWSAWPWPPGDLATFVDMPWTPFTRTWWLGPSFTAWAPFADWTPWSGASFQAWNSWLDQAPLMSSTRVANGAGMHAPDAGFASYRSAGGHAVAQVITPAAELAEFTATMVMTPIHALLEVWRAALKA